MQYFAMRKQDRNGQFMSGQPNPIYTEVRPDLDFAPSGYWFWLKSAAAHGFDVKAFDQNYVYIRSTELTWTDNTTFKRFVHDLPIAARCVDPDQPGAAIQVHDTTFQYFASCSAYKSSNVGSSRNDLDAPALIDAGGNIGQVMTRILHYRYHCDAGFQNCGDEEQFFLGKNSAWCQAATKTTAKDLSSFPLSSSGTISISETVSSGLAHLSYSENLQTVNASANPILMFVQEVTVEYSSGYRDVDRKEYERYFASRMLEPGETFQYGPADHGVKVLPVTNLTTSSPSCTIKTLFVQFADGSTFGDEKYASHILAIRKDIATALEHLNATYHDKGSKAFIQELNDTSKYSSDVNAFLDTHRAMFSQNLEAPPSAMNHVLGMIDRAESRRMLLAPTQQQ